MNKIGKTTAVLIFLAVFLWALSESEASELTPKIGLGSTVANSHLTTGEFSIEYRRWEVAVGIIGAGHTERGEQDSVNTFSVSRFVRPDWVILGGRNYYKMGIGYVDDSPLVGPINYRLGIGLEYRFVSVEYFHYSSAGIHKTNTGVDGIMVKFLF